eukprot:SAG11_NODE_522_length_8776_cov_6.087242_3_plen_122_part_00
MQTAQDPENRVGSRNTVGMELAALMDVEVLSSVVCFVMLCAACSPSPCAIPLAAFFIWGVDDQDYQATLNLFGGHWNLVAFGVTGAAIVSYWINGLLLLYIGELAVINLMQRVSCPPPMWN